MGKINIVFHRLKCREFSSQKLRVCMIFNWQYSHFPGRCAYVRLIKENKQKHADIFTKTNEKSLYLHWKTTKMIKNLSLSCPNTSEDVYSVHQVFVVHSPKKRARQLRRCLLWKIGDESKKNRNKIAICYRYCDNRAKEHKIFWCQFTFCLVLYFIYVLDTELARTNSGGKNDSHSELWLWESKSPNWRWELLPYEICWMLTAKYPRNLEHIFFSQMDRSWNSCMPGVSDHLNAICKFLCYAQWEFC